MKNCSLPLPARLRQRLFRHLVNFEILHRLFPHLEQEADHGYEFTTDAEMAQATATLDVVSLIETIEAQARQMPKAYGEAFLFVMRRDIHARVVRYARLAQREIPYSSRIPKLASECV